MAPNRAKITQDAVMIRQKLREHCTDNLGCFIHRYFWALSENQSVRIMNVYTLPSVIRVYLQVLR